MINTVLVSNLCSASDDLDVNRTPSSLCYSQHAFSYPFLNGTKPYDTVHSTMVIRPLNFTYKSLRKTM